MRTLTVITSLVVGCLLMLAPLTFTPTMILRGWIIFLPIGLLAFAGILIVRKTSTLKEERDGEERKKFFFQVPENHRFVFRAAIGSKPGNPLAKRNKDKGYRWYWEQQEGLAIFIPGVFIHEGIVSIKPQQRNCDAVTVTSRDRQLMEVDVQITTTIVDAKRFVIGVPGKNIEEKEKNRTRIEDSLLHTALNRICGFFIADELVSLRKLEVQGETDKKESEFVLSMENAQGRQYKPIGKKQIEIGDQIALGEITRKYLEKGLFLEKLYGIGVTQLGTQKARSPEKVQAEMERRTAAKIGEETALSQAKQIKTLIDVTEADKTLVTLGKILSDIFIPSKSKGRVSDKKNEGEEKNERQKNRKGK